MLKDTIKISPFFNIEIQWTEEETPQIYEISLKNTLKINQQNEPVNRTEVRLS